MELTGKSIEPRYIFGTAGEMAVGKTYTLVHLEVIAKSRGLSFGIVNIDSIRRDLLLKSSDPDAIQLRKNLIEALSLPISIDDPKISGDVLGNAIFFDDQKMDQYKKLINPVLLERVESNLKTGHEIKTLDWALLIEDDFLPTVNNNVLLVTCSRKEQTRRLQNADLSKAQLEARLRLHLSTEEKLAKIPADKVIVFDTSVPVKNKEYERLLDNILEKFRI